MGSITRVQNRTVALEISWGIPEATFRLAKIIRSKKLANGRFPTKHIKGRPLDQKLAHRMVNEIIEVKGDIDFREWELREWKGKWGSLIYGCQKTSALVNR